MATKKTASNKKTFLTVEVPAPVLRRVKAVASLRGLKMKEAVQQALERWTASAPELALTAGAAPPKQANPNRSTTSAAKAIEQVEPLLRPATVSRPAAGAGSYATRSAVPSSGAGPNAAGHELGDLLSEEEKIAAICRDLRRTEEMDWSACPALRARRTPDGRRVWVFDGTNFTLADLFISMEEGHSMSEIAGDLGLELNAVKEVLQIATQAVLAPARGREKA